MVWPETGYKSTWSDGRCGFWNCGISEQLHETQDGDAGRNSRDRMRRVGHIKDLS